jgi:hypothetical protein
MHLDRIYIFVYMPTTQTIGRKTSRVSKGRRVKSSQHLNTKEAKIKKFVDRFYRRYGKMMSKLSHE